jgi:hypothetical protein
MGTSTSLDIIKKSLQKIGVLAEGEEATAPQANDALDALNNMLDSWAARSLLTTAQIRESFTLTADKRTYTIGSGGDFDTSKPFEIASAFVRDSNNIDYGIDVVGREVYDSYTSKALTTYTTRPTNLFYDPGATQQATQLGTIYIYPTPDGTTTYTLFLESEKPFTQFTDLTSTITFPPSYKRAMIYNLAIEIAPDYGRPITPSVSSLAHESMRIIENVNARNNKFVAAMDFPGRQRNYNIYSDIDS